MNAQLASLSNQFVYASMTTFTLAFITFAISLAATRGRPAVTAAKVPVAVAAGGGFADAPATADTAAVAGGAPGVGAPGVGGGADVGGADVGGADVGGADPAGGLQPGRRSGNIAMSLTWLSTGLLLIAVVLRGFSASRVPWGNMYEFSLTAALAVAAVYLAVSIKHDLRWLGVVITGLVLLTLGLAVTVLYTESAQLVPALKSWWLIIHVSAAIICAGGFTLSAALSSMYLVRERAERKSAGGDVTGWLSSRLPAAERLDSLAYRVTAFVFPLWTFAVIAGAIWAESAWGRYWGWDPKETWAFITWVMYAGYLHARATAGWKGRRAAYIALLGFAAFLFNYFGVNIFVTGLHSYAGVGS